MESVAVNALPNTVLTASLEKLRRQLHEHFPEEAPGDLHVDVSLVLIPITEGESRDSRSEVLANAVADFGGAKLGRARSADPSSDLVEAWIQATARDAPVHHILLAERRTTARIISRCGMNLVKGIVFAHEGESASPFMTSFVIHARAPDGRPKT
jgi:hypothetical protein